MSDLQVTVTYGVTTSKTEVAKSDTPTEFERFEKLADALVQVPKTELDEKLKKS